MINVNKLCVTIVTIYMNISLFNECSCHAENTNAYDLISALADPTIIIFICEEKWFSPAKKLMYSDGCEIN